ncbi:hypothetical protein FQN50_004621 [Emmonsiellopsis sp. PD_5]|nr:hypothetical protein FQN50_004621 [Emmonsiellopsis sp. PD_5]
MASSSSTTTKYAPFVGPQEFSNLLPRLYKLYQTYSADLYTFGFLQNTTDLKVICQETTAETVHFNTTPELEDALQESTVIQSPETHSYIPRAPRDDGWGNWTDSTARELARELGFQRGESQSGTLLLGPLTEGMVLHHFGRYVIHGYSLYEYRPDHWVFTIRDFSISKLQDSSTNTKDFLLRSEILTVVALFYRQMNEIPWDYKNHRDGKPVLRYQGGSLTATVVTFLVGKVRVVQATCNPSEKLPTLVFTLRGLYDLSMSCYNKDTVCGIVNRSNAWLDLGRYAREVMGSWQYLEREEEGELLQEAKEKGATGVARYWISPKRQISGRADRGRLRTEAGPCTARKDDTSRRKRSPTSIDPSLPPSKRQSASPTKSRTNEATLNRSHRRIVVEDYGKPIAKARTRDSLLQGLEGCIDGYMSLYEKTGMIRSDTSPNNLMINEDGSDGSYPSFQIDLDLAIRRDRDEPSGARGKTGTQAFMSIGVLLGEKHPFLHNLESFFLVTEG